MKIECDFDLTNIYGLLPTDDPKETLENARWAIAGDIAGKGDHCACCGRWAKINAFNLTGTLLRKLILLCERSGERHRWVNTQDKKRFPGWFTHTNDHSKLAYWGLLQKDEQSGVNTKTVGRWRPTQRGLKFSRNKLQLPATAFVYDATVVGHSVKQVRAKDVKTKGYNYWEEIKMAWMAEKMKFPA